MGQTSLWTRLHALLDEDADADEGHTARPDPIRDALGAAPPDVEVAEHLNGVALLIERAPAQVYDWSKMGGTICLLAVLLNTALLCDAVLLPEAGGASALQPLWEPALGGSVFLLVSMAAVALAPLLHALALPVYRPTRERARSPLRVELTPHRVRLGEASVLVSRLQEPATQERLSRAMEAEGLWPEAEGWLQRLLRLWAARHALGSPADVPRALQRLARR